MKISKEFSVGVFVIIGCLITYCGNMFLKGNRLFSNDKIYYAYIEKLSGISVGTPILINEYNVGCVRNIEFLVSDGFKSKLTLAIRGDIQLTKNSLIYSGSTLMGTSFISLSVNPGEILNEEENINIGVSESLLDEVKAKVSPAIDSFNNLCINTNKFIEIINSEQAKIVGIISDLSLTIKNIKDTSIVLQNHLNDITGNINSILSSVNDKKQGIKSIMVKTNSILSKIDNIEFNELTTKVEGCIRKVHESMLVENTNETILELQNTVNSLNKLLIDIRLNPKRYVHFSVF